MKRLFVLLWVVVAFLSCTQAEIEITSKGITLPDNTVVHYLEAGQGPVLILVHGLGASSESWRPSMLHLAKRYHVIALDLHGPASPQTAGRLFIPIAAG
jgi:alpha-beta hydrolase superfamily lysophospholipase